MQMNKLNTPAHDLVNGKTPVSPLIEYIEFDEMIEEERNEKRRSSYYSDDIEVHENMLFKSHRF